MAKKKQYDDDDGRTIADMSEVEPMPLLFPRFPKRKDEETSEQKHEMSRQDRRAVLLGTIGATLLIGAVFIVAGAIVIFVMTKIWH